MIRDNYNIKKVKMSAGFSYGASSSHELEVYFEGMDTDKRGYIEKVSTYHLKEMGIIKKGYSFKKSQAFYDTEKGMKWLGEFLEKRDYVREHDDLIKDLRWKVASLDIDKLKKAIEYVDELKK